MTSVIVCVLIVLFVQEQEKREIQKKMLKSLHSNIKNDEGDEKWVMKKYGMFLKT